MAGRRKARLQPCPSARPGVQTEGRLRGEPAAGLQALRICRSWPSPKLGGSRSEVRRGGAPPCPSQVPRREKAPPRRRRGDSGRGIFAVGSRADWRRRRSLRLPYAGWSPHERGSSRAESREARVRQRPTQETLEEHPGLHPAPSDQPLSIRRARRVDGTCKPATVERRLWRT